MAKGRTLDKLFWIFVGLKRADNVVLHFFTAVNITTIVSATFVSWQNDHGRVIGEVFQRFELFSGYTSLPTKFGML